MVLLLLFFIPPNAPGCFNGFWLAHYVGFGGPSARKAAIAVGGFCWLPILVSADTTTVGAPRTLHAALIGGIPGALLITASYGHHKTQTRRHRGSPGVRLTATFGLGLY